ncbi:ketopantoate reductase family protein [Sporosarcina pasteurii]|uniref:2-dehydropantoate 2-reductase n=1 Tax=Sporosarcina pasteurii TaxID=1474 RepID=A0A380BH92_SPOPA|nr:2-dehydropantoate 2-reductase [Sporosarcina pasteurii]MDS9470487.1 2-dehydropantoate 2-reductase [Sporosarcina pasteurii]SUJ00387.1 Probable 2-dehydropantoate 2-reductase [Sporosarcina pasteurii]
MDIAVVGAGSIGMLMGSYLSESGLDVTMIVRSDEQKERINEEGICRVHEDGTGSVVTVSAVTGLTEAATAKLVVVAVKYSDLKTVLNEFREKEIRTPLLFIQNGIGHLNLVEECEFPHVAFATVEHGALKSDHRTVHHNGVGNLTIGERFGDKNKFNIIEKASNDRFPVIRHPNGEHILLRKVLINCLINPLTTILGITNGELLTNPYGHQLMKELYEELMQAFTEMRKELPFTAVESVCRNTARNHSSMLMDRLAKRPMEIETIVSATIQKAQLTQRELPLLKNYERILLAFDEKVKC